MPDSGNSLYYSCADIKLTSPVVADTTAPAAVTNLSLQADTQVIRLSWQNPAQDYAQTMVVQSTEPLGEYPQAGVEYRLGTSLGNGKVVLLGAQTQYQSPQLAAGSIYYYTVFALDASRNYSKLAQAYGQLAQANRAPTVSLQAEQGGQIKDKFITNGGIVTLQARVQDADPSDTHKLDWAGTDYRLLDITANDAALTFDPSGLKAGTYKVVIKATDSGTPSLSGRIEKDLVIEEPPAAPVTAGSLGLYELLLLSGLLLAGVNLRKAWLRG
jgi:hypothetical protein